MATTRRFWPSHRLSWTLALAWAACTGVEPVIPRAHSVGPTIDSGEPPVQVVESVDDGADARWSGTGAGDWAGRQVAWAGDVNGDGVGDVLVTALWNDDAAEDAGAAYLLAGPPATGGSLVDADAALLGEAAHDAAGVSATSAGDLNGDGFADVIVGADGHDVPHPNTGAVYLVHGPISGLVELQASTVAAKGFGERRGDLAGVSVAGVGDPTGDGFDDVLVGARYNDAGFGPGDDDGDVDAGAAYLVDGATEGMFTLGGAHAKIVGEAAGDWLGISVATAGDIDGDGIPDLAIGALYQDGGGLDAGAAYVVPGSAAGVLVVGEAAMAKWVGEAAFDEAGRVSGGGDTDGDGFDDLWIGAARNDGAPGIDSGAAYLVRGPTSGVHALSDADAIFVGEGPANETAFRLAIAGDVDGDGNDDLLIGAWLDDAGGVDAGSCYLLYGPVDGARSLKFADHVWRGAAPLDRLGSSVAGGDVDGDGLADVLLGASNQDAGAVDAGAAYVVFATSLP